MADIVLGVATSHSPQVSSPISVWPAQANRDQRRLQLVGPGGQVKSYDELVVAAPQSLGAELERDVWESKYARIQRGVDQLAAVVREVDPDILVVVGDDQKEMLLDDAHPALAVYTGEALTDIPPTPEERATLGTMSLAAQWARHAQAEESYPLDTDLARHLVSRLASYGVVEVARQPDGRSIGHAYTFVRLRLTPDIAPKPMVPVFVNCLYGSNRPTAAQCLRLGEDIAAAVAGWDSDKRVALVASGGLSHYVVDEDLDRRVLHGLASHDDEHLVDIEDELLESGNGEIRNWLVLGGALRRHRMTLVDYVPAYRSPAGTGVGMAFAYWK
jgi:hypothetical protein